MSGKKKREKTLQVNYSKAPYYMENIDLIQQLIYYNNGSLSEYNTNAIITLAEYLGIKSTFVKSSSLQVSNTSSERLVEIIKKLNGDTYLSGKGGDKYQKNILFESNQITLLYNEFEHPVYHQTNTKQFLKGLSILDFLFNLGKDKVRELIISLKY